MNFTEISYFIGYSKGKITKNDSLQLKATKGSFTPKINHHEPSTRINPARTRGFMGLPIRTCVDQDFDSKTDLALSKSMGGLKWSYHQAAK